MEYFAHTRDDGGKRFWKKYTTRRNVCSAIWSPAKGKEHIVTATLGEGGQVHLYDPQNNSTAVGDKAIRGYINYIGARATNYTYAMDVTNYRMDEEYCDKIMIKERGKNGTKKGTEQEGN